ncbi:MAG TPA: hypothetical protein VIH21_01655 [Dehalococcoidia bacterium]|jgi:hypothetical protein
MLKYTIGSLAGGLALIVAVFVVLAWWNGRDAEAGPPPAVTITITAVGTASPPNIKLDRGRLVDLTLINEAAQSARATLDAEGVQQLVASSTGELFGEHSAASLASVLIDVPARSTRSAPVRFSTSGTFELEVAVGGRERAVVVEVVVS